MAPVALCSAVGIAAIDAMSFMASTLAPRAARQL
jgi:hypothetical protein